MKKPLPPRDVPWFDTITGRPTDIFFDWAKSIDQRVLRQPVNLTDPAEDDVLTFNATTNEWGPE